VVHNERGDTKARDEAARAWRSAGDTRRRAEVEATLLQELKDLQAVVAKMSVHIATS
jgi:adenylosuccinate lyase